MNAPVDQELNGFLNKARPLPALPAAIPTPEIDYSFNSAGAIVTEITVPGNGGTVTFRNGPKADPTTDAWGMTAPFFVELTTAEKDAFLDWGYAVHIRLIATIADFLKALSETTPGFKGDIIDAVRL